MTSVMRKGAGLLKRELQVARIAEFDLIELGHGGLVLALL